MKVAFAKTHDAAVGATAVAVRTGRLLTPAGAALDAVLGGAVTRAMEVGRFEGKRDSTLTLLAPAGLDKARIVLVGVGDAKPGDALAAEAFGGTAVAQMLSSGERRLTLLADLSEDEALFAAHAALGARLRAWRFDKYLTREKKDEKPALDRIQVTCTHPVSAKTTYQSLEKVAEGVLFTRALVAEPANVIHPESFAERVAALSALGVEVEVLGEKQMKKLGMGALLGVGQGSARESKLVVMRWQGATDPEAAPLALIGKGVTFDSGGISIKPAQGMEDMKWDMAGAAAVAGAMMALAGRKARANVVGVVGLVENMPSGTAQRPGDVVTSMSGQTIEVINTDAEGRLVLADALHYTKERFKPSAMIDLATLTGAIIVTLGNEYGGLFTGDDALADKITAAGKAVGEPVWRLPLGEAYDKMLKSDIADMKNVGGREAGSITAAQFLKRFVGDTPWAHLDIAGMVWSKKDAPVTPKGATAFGVRLLDRLVADGFEAS